MSDLIQIVAEWLKANEYEGLYSEMMGCGCELNDLMPCGEPSLQCKPGYRGGCDEHCEFGGGCDFHIQADKP